MTTTTDRRQTTDRHTFGGKEPPERLTNDILTFPPQPSLPQKEVTLCLLSQLELGGEWLGPTLLAVYWLVGSLGVPGEQEAVARVGRLIIAGDSLASSTKDQGEQARSKYQTVGTAAQGSRKCCTVYHPKNFPTCCLTESVKFKITICVQSPGKICY